MGALLVVELHEGLERPLHRPDRGEVLPAKLNAPMLVQDRALQALHAGRFCSTILADFGARVIKLEPRGPGDIGRAWGTPL